MTGFSGNGGPRIKTKPDDRRGAKPGTGIVPTAFGGRIGQAPHEPTEMLRMQARTLSAYCTQAITATKMGISKSTLRRHYAAEIEEGYAEAVADIGALLVKQARGGCRASQMFYLRTKGGWSSKLEVSGPGGGPVQHAHIDFTAFLSGKSPDELRLLLPLIDQLIAVSGGGGVDTEFVGTEETDPDDYIRTPISGDAG